MTQAPTIEAGTQWIGGQSQTSISDCDVVVRDPADESTLAVVPRGSAQEADVSLRAASTAQPDWARRGVSDRGGLLREAAERLTEHADTIAELLVRENGKPIAAAQAEIALAIEWINSIVELGIHQTGRCVPTEHSQLLFQRVTPRGVAVCLNTWNAPVIAAIEMAAANLIVGNTVVLKTSERAPLATRLAFESCFDHLPSGTLNVVSGDGPNMGAPLVDHAQTDVVCFIGSVDVGRRIGEAAGRRLRKAVLELGGKDALIIDDTVDLKAAAAFAGASCFANSGQICTSTERIYVLRTVHDRFVRELCDVAAAIQVGPGLDPATQMGPMIDQAILAHVESQVADAVKQGAEVKIGAQRLDRPGYFYPPTVLTRVEDDMPLMCEETFGPVAPIAPVDSMEEAIQRTNRSQFGLATIVYTESAPTAHQMIERLDTGMIRINAPRGQRTQCCGEPTGDSGIGFGHGPEFLRELVYRKSIQWRARLDG